MNTNTAPAPAIRITRDAFFADDYLLSVNFERATAFRAAWQLAVEEHGTKMQRRILRNWMRDYALAAVRHAKRCAAA